MLDMVDDIDIEEHDIFDNPLIKKIFPDISKLKKEIEEEPIIKDVQEENISTRLVLDESQSFDLHVKETHAKTQNFYANTKEIHSNNRKPFLASEKKPCALLLPSKLVLSSIPTLISRNAINNTKSNKGNSVLTSYLQVKVVLEDIKIFLEQKHTYCKICMILFPSKSKFDIHKEIVHGTINHCTISKLNSYKRHQIEEWNADHSLRNNFKRNCVKSYKAGFRTDVMTYTENNGKTLYSHSATKGFRCLHCPTIFLDEKSLIEHLYHVLASGENKLSKQLVPQEKCDLVNKSIIEKNVFVNLADEETSDDDDQLSVDDHDDVIYDNSRYNNVKTYNEENVSSKNNNDYSEKNNKVIQNEVIPTKNKKKWFSCPICSYYIKDEETYLKHLGNNHSRGKQTSVEQVLFNPYCKICSIYQGDYNNYNKHIRKRHLIEYTRRVKILPDDDLIKDKILKNNLLKVNDSHSWKLPRNYKVPFTKFKPTHRVFALKSLLFKCGKCEIHFFSVHDAMRHSDHAELLPEWRCSICQLVFKKEGNLLHMKQHDVSKNINVVDIYENNIDKYLYSCIKCAVYFEESRYMQHYHSCESTPSDSGYCKVCDILIDRRVIEHHKYLHKHEKMKLSDFIYISSIEILEDADNLYKTSNSEMETEEHVFSKEDPSQLHIKRMVLYYCKSCKSYINDVAHNHKAHLEARCSNIMKHNCKHCGLVITNQSFYSHKKEHRIKTNLKLSDFIFLDLNGKKIKPPIPEYSKCHICNLQFLSKSAVENHTCGDVEYITCQKCDTKMSYRAYKMHIPFHEFTTKNKDITKIKKLVQENETSTKIKQTKTSEQMVDNISSNEKVLIFSCKSCYLSLHEYDKVVEHCQEHNIRNKVIDTLKTCHGCSLKFTAEYYDIHCNICSTNKTEFYIVIFNPYYFKAENKVWLKHTFQSLSPKRVQRIIFNSIYEFEHRAKMTIIQQGQSHITVYKCDQCRRFTDPIYIKSHIEDICKKNNLQYPCSICGLNFDLLSAQGKHEKIHEYQDINLKALRIVTFNRNEDKVYNRFITSCELHILYQCRNCDVVVQKSNCKTHRCQNDNIKQCDKCGLNFQRDDYDNHLKHHVNLANFNDGYMKVVMFGRRKEPSTNNHLIPSYVGILCDYNLFQCVQCGTCFDTEQNISKHKFSSKKFKCSECNLFFSTLNNLHKHVEQHKKDSLFLIDNINIIQIDYTLCRNNLNLSLGSIKGTDKTVKYAELCAMNDQGNNNECVKIYKCKCGLHIINRVAAIEHYDNCNFKSRRSKQNCSKCNLLFTTSELFNHLITHHANKDMFRYYIEELHKVRDSLDKT